MNSTEILVDGIEYKVKKLIVQKKQLEKEKAELQKQIEELQQQNIDKENRIKDLEQRVETTRAAKSVSNNDDVQAIHQRIDKLVREIDKSIELLNNTDK
ncbi:MAG: hypothetical protein K9J27_09260 [Bacteroidales bacterium]|nr:hypothetical protein [Bacteroidales bacterium]MCF8333879.1 hypothetical protein [Bacteroidales bacterium]